MTDAQEEIHTSNEELEQAADKEAANNEALQSENEAEPKEQEENTNDEGNIEEDDQIDAAAEEPVASKPLSRAQQRIQSLSASAKSEREAKEQAMRERAVLQAQLDFHRQQQHDSQSAQQRKAEEERLSLLDPSERRNYELEKKYRDMEYRLNQMELNRQDETDRANFHARATTDETYGKYADQVEKMYQDGRARGVLASREDLHSFILGRELKKDLATKVSKKKETASKRIDSATAKPANAKGDVAGSKKVTSEEDRLRGVPI